MSAPRRSLAELVAGAALAALSEESTPRPAALLGTVARWLEGYPDLPGAVEAIPLALRAGVQHDWPPAVNRWRAFKVLAAHEARRAVGYRAPFSETAFGAWLGARSRARWPAGTAPPLDWLEGLYREAFTHHGLAAPPGLPDWWPLIVGPPAGPADGEGPDCVLFAEAQCQGHPALRSRLLQLHTDEHTFRFRNGLRLTYLEFLRLRYQNFPGSDGLTPTAGELAPYLGVADNTVDVYLGRVRDKLLLLLQQARDNAELNVSAAWMDRDRVLPPPNRYAVAWPLTDRASAASNGARDEEVVHVGLFAWALPSTEQLHALVEKECQGHDALRGALLALAAVPVPLAQDGRPMTALEFVHACYRNRLGELFPPPSADVLALELRAAGLVSEGPEGPAITARTVTGVLNQVRREVERLLEEARESGRLRASAEWARRALPPPAMYARGHLFYPLPKK